MRHAIWITTLALMGATNVATAGWSGIGKAGLVMASGNTDTETGNASLNLALERGLWTHTIDLSGLYAATDGDKTAERWEIRERSDYRFRPKTFLFVGGRYENDEFSGFDYQATTSLGIGHYFRESENTNLVATAGVGYKFSETSDVFDATGTLLQPSDKQNEVVFRATADLDHGLTASTRLIAKSAVESGSSNTFIDASLGLQVKMSDRLALSATYGIRHNTDVPTGFKKTDKLTTLNLVYEFN